MLRTLTPAESGASGQLESTTSEIINNQNDKIVHRSICTHMSMSVCVCIRVKLCTIVNMCEACVGTYMCGAGLRAYIPCVCASVCASETESLVLTTSFIIFSLA